MKDIKFYRCDICGNIVALIKSGDGTLVCCDQEMTLLEANTIDASVEKHVPVVEKEDGKINVTVGSTIHPMTEAHYIEWIALATEDKINLIYLKPDMEPKAEFTYSSEDDQKDFTVYEYCNLHGLWKA
jgi:superoxide reductase